MSRPHALIELRVWALMAVPMGMLAGGVTGVLVSTVYTEVTTPFGLGLAVALVTGAGPLANLFSVLWSHWSRGRDKVAALGRMQAGYACCLLIIAVVPLSSAGLAVLVAAVVAAQTVWCGIITIRASIWRANYTRAARTRFAAANQIVVSVCMSSAGAAAGLVLDLDATGFRWLFVAACACALASLAAFRRVKVRRHRQLRAAEIRSGDGGRFSPALFWSILRDDPLYRKYMVCMMVFGAGNLMITAPLILVLTNNLAAPRFAQVLIAASVPTLLMPVSTPFWARILASRHIIAFRKINSRVYVAAMICFLAAATLSLMPLMWLGAVLLGLGIGGGALGWNLGHNDFAPDERVAEYLGLHVTLTGLRGLLAPLLGVGLYAILESRWSGSGVWSLALPCLLTASGAAGFHWIDRTTRTDWSAALR